MKQILQSARSGELELVEVPEPTVRSGQVRIRNAFSVMSPGTEKLMMDFARKSLLQKARSRPDLVKQVVRKIQHEGPQATYRTVTTRLDAPQPLGYSTAGVVEAVGPGVSDFEIGDRVACAGAGYANHAEWIVVPENLLARVPDEVPLEKAAFATLGAIAMQGVRVAQPALGEIVAVVGLGLIGQICTQLLRANGCRVLGLDLDPVRIEETRQQGAEWVYRVGDLPATWKDAETFGYGVDFAMVTAGAATAAPLHMASELCRHKGRVVVVGMMPLDLERRTAYDKELELRMSTSYGPGRYDRSYEEVGLDYPLPYVRWTENRNLQSFLALAASGAIDPGMLNTEQVPFSEAANAYEELASGERRGLAVVFRYDAPSERQRTLRLSSTARATSRDSLGISMLGAGAYARGVLLPALSSTSGLQRVQIVAATGPSARRTAEKFDFEACGTDVDAVLEDSDTDLVVIATRHDSHADLGARALRAGKAVWLEKPAGLSPSDVCDLVVANDETDGFLVLGYNRRFSSHARQIRSAFEGRSGPLAIRYMVAAGPTPVGTWIVDRAEGGGRIIGEVCHFVDLCVFLVGDLPTSVYARALGRQPDQDDSTTILLSFPDGSTAVIEYLAHASADLPKERFEVSGDDRTARCENYRTTEISGRKRYRTLNQDKGQETAIREVVAALRAGKPAPFSSAEIAGVSACTFAIQESIRTGEAVTLDSILESAGPDTGPTASSD
ncbi:MAG: Gfo/Idh/MocA family oxidoreductase [bacterium]|nr:Gfo/Idh/MocA family oxidoreductase [bacterium]